VACRTSEEAIAVLRGAGVVDPTVEPGESCGCGVPHWWLAPLPEEMAVLARQGLQAEWRGPEGSLFVDSVALCADCGRESAEISVAWTNIRHPERMASIDVCAACATHNYGAGETDDLLA